MSGHTYIHTHIHTYTHTYAHDNYSNPSIIIKLNIVNIYIEIKISKNGDLRWAGQTKYITQGDWMVGRNRTKQKLDDAID